ncbi:PREDICTED: uncharacterized protein LOC105571010 [Vollenhovia emeryi]|uniref:uncharacterized protein LOC105571010 n=1 Tax=Vollenhovia emeryi TaxID=411798 RepID=UPI0005F4304C|nr:PREDICTED: uncharacterized protein LOC105571010 [Vollenhovia emeryi]
MPKAVDRMNFEKKFYTSYEQNEASIFSSLECTDLKKRRIDSTQSDCSGEPFVSPLVLDLQVDTDNEQQTTAILNDIKISSTISLNEEIISLTEKETITLPAVPSFLENSDLKDNYVWKILIKSVEGKSVLAQYERTGLDNSARLKLANVVVVSEFGCDTQKVYVSVKLLTLLKSLMLSRCLKC